MASLPLGGLPTRGRGEYLVGMGRAQLGVGPVVVGGEPKQAASAVPSRVRWGRVVVLVGLAIFGAIHDGFQG